MKLQKFVNILDQDCIVASDFFEKHGRYIFENDKLLLALIKEKWSRKKFLKLFALGWIVAIDVGSPHSGEKRHFINILPVYVYLREYISSCCAFFGNKRIPWEEWEDLAKEQVELLEILIKENKLEQFADDKRYHDFCDKYDQREEDLVKKGYHQLWDGEYI